MTVPTRQQLLGCARAYALSVLCEGPLTTEGMVVYRIQQRVLYSLERQGYVRFYPYGKPPSFRITKTGKVAIHAWRVRREKH